MNKLRSILVCSFIFISIQISWCQNYLYSNETPDVYRKDNSCVIAENYLKEKFIPKGWKYNRNSAAAYKFPNGNKLIVINGVTSYTEKQELYSENGFLTNEGYTNHVSKLKENEENIYYAIVVSASGKAIKAIKVCPRFVISVLKDDRFLIIASETNKSETTYTNVVCFDYNGNDKWTVKPGNMIIYDYAFWQDKLYVVGEKNNYSYYRIISLNSGSIVDEAEVNKNYTFTRIDIESDGINLEEKHYDTFYYGKAYNNVKTYKASHSTKLLSSIQSAKPNRQGQVTQSNGLKGVIINENYYNYKFESALDGSINDQNFLYDNIVKIILYDSLCKKISKAYVKGKKYSNSKWEFLLRWITYLYGEKIEMSRPTPKDWRGEETLEMRDAIKEIEKLASSGDAEAMRKLGLIYLDTFNVKEGDEETGLAWLIKAEQQGNKDAAIRLIWIYDGNWGFKKNGKLKKSLEKKWGITHKDVLYYHTL